MRKPCCEVKEMNKGAWSKQEDQKLIDYINKHGEVCWSTLPQAAGLLRCGKSCRLRWINYLRPDLKRGNFGEDEEDLIIKLHALLGNRCNFKYEQPFKWSLIAGRLPGRTDNDVKNYWNSHVRRKLISNGIDPNNHRLNYKTPTFQNPPPLSHSSKSFGLKSIRKNIETISKTHVDKYEVSDESHVLLLPDLNLDLTISIPSHSPTISESSRKLHFASPSTHLLFQ